MGAYNSVYMDFRCPKCGEESFMQIDLYFGFLRLIDYKIGDKIQWLENKEAKNGGQPENGDLDGEGYAECNICGKDFFVKAIVRNSILTDIVVDKEKEGYIR